MCVAKSQAATHDVTSTKLAQVLEDLDAIDGERDVRSAKQVQVNGLVAG